MCHLCIMLVFVAYRDLNELLQHCVFNFHYSVIINRIYFRNSHYIYAFSLSFCQECVQVIFHTQIKRNMQEIIFIMKQMKP